MTDDIGDTIALDYEIYGEQECDVAIDIGKHGPRIVKELILYLALQSENDQHYGGTKLQLLLFLSEFKAYSWTGSSITGANYVRERFGPVLEDYKDVERSLLASGDAHIALVKRGALTQRRLTPLRAPNCQYLSKTAFRAAHAALDELECDNAVTLKGFAQSWVGWQAATGREVIPFSLAFVWDRGLTAGEMTKGREIGERHAA